MKRKGLGDVSFDSLLEHTVGCARDLWLKGWAEGGAGNLSVRVDPALLQGMSGVHQNQAWLETGWKVPELGGVSFLVSARGGLFRCMQDRPCESCGVIELDRDGAHYRKVWGFEPDGVPSSELPSHLAAHAADAARGGGGRGGSAVVHVHATNLVALTCARRLDTVSLTRLLWSCHAECVALFPEGIEVAAWCLPGSTELSAATARGLDKRRLVLWPFHGVIAAGCRLDEAVGLIETAEKASEIYLRACVAGGTANRLTDQALRDIAAHFGVVPDQGILEGPAPDGSGTGS